MLELSEKQVELVRFCARGYTRAQISDATGISERMVKWHLDRIRDRLGVRTAREIPEAFMAATGESPYPTGRAA